MVMDHRLDNITRDGVSIFATIFSVVSTIHPGPLPVLPSSSQPETTPSGDPSIVVHAVAQ